MLLFAFGVALVSRVLSLGQLPATFFVDEVLSGYLGRYLWETGQDLYGNPWLLLYFNKFGDYYIILPMYLDGLSTFLFGVTRFATRFPTAVLGALTVFPMYGVATGVFRSKRVGILAAFLLATNPWHIVLSRATTESVIELFVLSITVWLLIRYVDTSQPKYALVGAVFFSLLSYLIYHTARILIPLIWFGVLAVAAVQVWQKYFSSQKRLIFQLQNLRHVVLLGCFLGIFVFLTVGISQTQWGRGRFEQTSIFSVQSGVSIRMQEMTFNLGPDAVLLARIFHNKLVGYGREFLSQYTSYFSPHFLVTTYAWEGTRYAVPEVGPLYVVTLFMLFGYLVSGGKKKFLSQQFVFLLLWLLLIAPIPASLTVIESPNVRRSLFLVFPLIILAAGGWNRLFAVGWRGLSVGSFLGIILIGEAFFFGYHYAWQSDRVNALYRTDALPQVAEYVFAEERRDTPQYVFQTTDFPLYVLFQEQDFDPVWSEKFAFGAQLEQIGSVTLLPYECPQALEPEDILSHADEALYYQPPQCEVDPCWFEQVATLSAVNPALGYEVLRRVPDENVPAKCTPRAALESAATSTF